jgi:hypothetical protein
MWRDRLFTQAYLTLAALVLSAGAASAGGPDDMYTIAPCRAVDTRFAGGMIAAGTSRPFKIRGALTSQGGAATCNVPDAARSIFANFTAVQPTATGFLTAYPYPQAQPVSSTLNFQAGVTAIANGQLLPLCDLGAQGVCPSDVTVAINQASAHVIIDVTAYTQARQ